MIQFLLHHLLLLLLLSLLKHLAYPTLRTVVPKSAVTKQRPLERMSQVESQPGKRSYLLDARLNDSKTSRENREMKGRDSPCWRYHAMQYICQTRSPQVTPAVFCGSGRDWAELQRREIIQRMFRWAGAGCS